MGIFSSIKNAIFGKKEEAAATPAPAPVPTPGTESSGWGSPAAKAEITEVDVEARLDAMDGAADLNWRNSIVDLMKLLGIDSSFANRKELATELGDNDYSGTAEENIWLHKKTMQELAKNGGKVPTQFLD